MRQQLDQQGFGKAKRLENSKSETKTLKVGGRDCKFEFTQGVDPKTGQKRRQVAGFFEGKHGPTLIVIDMDDAAYKEDQIVKMLEGIQ